MMLDNEKLITKLKYRFGNKFPFLAGLCNNVNVKLVDEPIRTPDGSSSPAMVCGLDITIHKEYVKDDFETALGVFAHEVMHVALLHGARYAELVEQGLGKEWRMAYNILADLRINTILKSENMKMPVEAVWPENVLAGLEQSGFTKRKGMDELTAEIVDTACADEGLSVDRSFGLFRQYYEYEYGEGDGDGEGDGGSGGKQGGGSTKSTFNGNDLSAGVQRSVELKKDIQQKIIGSLVMNKGAGRGVSELMRKFELMYYDDAPDWGKILKQLVAQEMRKVHDWNYPHKKSIELDFCPNMPSYRDYPYKYLLAVAVDTSGSMDAMQINKIMGEVYKLVKHYPIEIDVMFCDYDVGKYVSGVKSINDFEKIVCASGGGGTAFKPVFDKIKKLRLEKGKKRRKHNTLLYFTDGEGSDNDSLEEVKGLKTYWIVDNKDEVKFSFGNVIKIR